MIIAFYPGAGGNRFYQWLINAEQEFKANQIYDGLNPDQIKANRYPGRQANLIDAPVVFTHCVNYDLIVKTWPNHSQVYILGVDLYQSLRRRWQLEGKKVSVNRHPVGGPFGMINWHIEYYSEYPYQVGDSIVVDQQTFPGFLRMMQNELESIVCPEFDFALQMFNQHGSTAPILDLYKENFGGGRV